MAYLKYEDQFRDILRKEEISQIENIDLRDIRMKFWQMRRDSFLEESNSNSDMDIIWNRLKELEQEEIQIFKTKYD